jgi:predicted nucleotidyltransferase
MGLKDEMVQEIVRRILSVATPERVILFGSAALGKMTRDSDVDLLVLLPDITHGREESTKIRMALGDLGFPIDVVPMSSNWFEATKDLVGGLAYPAHHEGRVIYARS